MRVYLTFDDGPSEWTEPILDLLEDHGAKATFFLLGCWIVGREDIVQRMHNGGHTIGVHGWTHRRLTHLDSVTVQRELGSTADLIDEITFVRPAFYRGPHLDTDERVDALARTEGLEHVGADIDPGDWREPSAFLIADHVGMNAYDGCIVDLHDGIAPQNRGTRTRQPTVEAVERLLTKDWEFAALQVPVAA